MLSLLLLLSFLHDIHSAGFAGNTLLLTKQNHITFDTVNANTLIQSDKNSFQPILFMAKQSATKVVQISIANEIIICHKKQLFWCVHKNNWICAKDLMLGDLLQTVDGQSIAIDAVALIEQQTELYSLTVAPPHYLYVGKYNVLAHNMAWFFGVGMQFALESGAIELIKATVSFAIGGIALHFAKNKNKKKPKACVSIVSSCKSPQIDPDDDKNEYTFKNGIYEDADYHIATQNGLKSPRPQDGQKALDNSYAVKGSDQRIAIENDKFVILRRTSNQKYHGYVMNWKELETGGSRYQNLINTLIDNRLVKHSGKIIK